MICAYATVATATGHGCLLYHDFHLYLHTSNLTARQMQVQVQEFPTAKRRTPASPGDAKKAQTSGALAVRGRNSRNAA
jgi:hypothetical protein